MIAPRNGRPDQRAGGHERAFGVQPPVEVCLDSAEENMVPGLALRADRVLEERWNGWARPLATAEALSDFLGRWRENDPNGVWGEAFEVDGQLACTRSDEDELELFPSAGANSGGVPLYDLTGWVWVELDAIDEYYGDRR